MQTARIVLSSMIKECDIFPAGSLIKPHGVRGEIVVMLDRDVDIRQARCIVVNIDGIYVPFFIDEIRMRSANSLLIHIDGVNFESDAKELCGNDLFLLKADFADCGQNQDEGDGFYLSDLIGFMVVTPEGQRIGRITDFDDSTDNVVLMVEEIENSDDPISYIPIAEELIENIDMDKLEIVMIVPSGLIGLNRN